jgi:hypothetical protein
MLEMTFNNDNASSFRHGMNMVNQILRLVAIEQAESNDSV